MYENFLNQKTLNSYDKNKNNPDFEFEYYEVNQAKYNASCGGSSNGFRSYDENQKSWRYFLFN